MAEIRKRKLGKGLSALLDPKTVSDASEPEVRLAGMDDGDRILHIAPKSIRSNPKQPRRVFDEEALQELAASISRDGVQEPIIVRRVADSYEIVCGERRCRAAIMAGLETIPALCREVSDGDMLKFGLIENIQREDLNAIELALAYRQLMDEYQWTQELLAEEVGKKRATVANTLRLLQLPEVIQEQVADGTLSMGHARALLALPDAQAQLALARKIARQGLSVRQAEHLAAQQTRRQPRTPRPAPGKDPHIAQIEDSLRRRLGAKVTVKQQHPERGRIEIEYYSLDELERLLLSLGSA